MIPANNSLVKYSTPVLVSVAGKKKDIKKKPSQTGPSGANANQSQMINQTQMQEKKETHRTEDILSQILPPKEYTLENGQLWIQTVLSTPATRTEVIQLQEDLDRKLQQRQARETGICPIREELYEQCFDELIRQITIDCRQRGLLLVRVRDEFKNQLEAYKTLYESSIAYGMRKMIDSEQKKTDMRTQIMQLERECEELSKAVDELEEKISFTKKNENEKLNNENEIHRVETEKIKQNNTKLKEELQALLEGKK
ncbi:33 kDa inner dynein arm light chain, axonemal protein (macronuclear) [Tetrahymena thermophila SB210]|uniref:33 kDa inner dynein arm light chain, axonemal protein n=2 Tax=Tetrahymena thermophila TaxID=5911 RepID=Q24F53_TETTS|nr:33 kDa inner dynein arm light chain, axonemal protein [Tetrahymena thermophila SB210]ABF38949.1 dynein light chain p28C [Tetrahymena thermophila]EAS06422.1 33 kDa inner dynein arm light chain, axonemal protein [Tetrahymena thermophila SB210]|eukprot:XP_001026667.1 33 kDa inner dynein arm light chain, axonemal protein [Tetrahymena thermophila SB210]